MPELKEIVLEDVLERHLGRVSAPEELWRRVNAGTSRARDSRPVFRRWAWSMAAAMLVGGAAWMVPHRPDAELRSASASQVREWVKAQADVDVPLRDSSAVRLIGAHVENHRAAIASSVGTLTVVAAPGSIDNHVSAVKESRSGGKLVSWTMRGQAFTLACDDPDQMHAACLLCHS